MMNRPISLLLILGLVALGDECFREPSTLLAQATETELPAVENNIESETLTRGPLHEAFAEQVNYDAQAGILVSKPPPEPIEELPPDVQPEGSRIEWIPGYWAWDEERDDYLWVSGVWRDIPPGRRWVPGYWAEVNGGYQWIAGFWNLEDADSVEYLPYPPLSLERGPTSPQPSVDHYWVSGCWQYQDQRYLWRPGFWNGYREDWIWTPAHYVWTPRGAIYIHGYWDYPLSRRGVLFAPVYFPRYTSWRQPCRYSPGVVINLHNVLSHLFVQPSHHHYYWGDYYGNRYRRSGYHANFQFHGRTGYDPLFCYYSTQYRRQGVDYASRLRDWHSNLERHQAQRPVHTWKQQQSLVARVGYTAPSNLRLLAQPLREAVKDSHAGLKFRHLDSDGRQSLGRNSQELTELVQRRRSTEAGSPLGGRVGEGIAKPLGLGRTTSSLALPKSNAHAPILGAKAPPARAESRRLEPRDKTAARSMERAIFDRLQSGAKETRDHRTGSVDSRRQDSQRSDHDRVNQTIPLPSAGSRAKPATARPSGIRPMDARVSPPKPSSSKMAEAKRVEVPSVATPRIGTQPAPEPRRTTPSVSARPQLELPKASFQTQTSRSIELPPHRATPTPSLAGRRPDGALSGAQPAATTRAKPATGLQPSSRFQPRRDVISPRPPHTRATLPAAKPALQGNARTGAAGTAAAWRGRSNASIGRAPAGPTRSESPTRSRTDDRRSKR